MLANYTYGNNNQQNTMVSPAVTYPVSLMTQYAYKDPQFALGNLIGSYLAQRFLGNTVKGELENSQESVANNADFQNTLNANAGNKFSLDANGNAVYNTPAFLPATYSDAAVTGGGIAGTSFKDYLDNVNQTNSGGLLNYQQLAQQAGITPQAQAVAQTGQAMSGLLPTSTSAPAATGSIPAIDGSFGLKTGNVSFNIGGGTSPFSNGWTYNNPYLKKDRGDIAGQGAVSPENGSEDPAVYTIDEKFPGMVKEGNIDLASRPVVHLPDGSIATVRSIGVNIDGKEYLLPTVSQDGRLLSNDEAVDEFKRTGKYLGIFDSPEASDRYAEALHNQQDKMYRRRPENAADNSQPIQPVDENPIKPANEYPIQPSTPITEDRKEVLDGNNLRIMSANDGQVYDFTVSDDGNWITFGNARMPIQSKNQLISAMHDPNQSFRNIEEMATSTHNNAPVMSESDAAIISQDPSRRTEWLNLMNNQDRRDMTDADNPGVYPTWYVSANNAMRNAQNNPNAQIDSNNAPQPFNADEWQRDFAIRQLRRGVSPEAINSMLSVLMPTMQRREDDYNRYQESAIWPTYYAAIQQGDYGTAAQLGEAMLQYNPNLGSMMLNNIPGGRDYWTSAEAVRRAERQQAANIAAEQRNRQYKIEDSNREYQQSVDLKMLDHKLSQIDKAWDYQQKLAFQRASNQDKVDMLTNAGMSPQEATFTVYGGKKSGDNSSSNNRRYQQLKDWIDSYEKAHANDPDTSWKDDYDYRLRKEEFNRYTEPQYDFNNANDLYSFATDLIMSGEYSDEEIKNTLRNVSPEMAENVISTYQKEGKLK
ncbi:hypothetical protein [uncultured Megasphaera sp.]|uniref:hypothetical protein n=1 Tax=uncultured Megasphaera sp. TaxID=165188 RepID=UPI00265CA1C9|nr:hypothetical protein [uncultured Megasphaera sp.]